MVVNLASIAGALRLRPGLRAPANLASTRQNWAARLTKGKKASTLPTLVASLYNLCGQSHYLCNQLALGAASGEARVALSGARRLQHETAGEHIRRIALDWPRLFSRETARSTEATLQLRADLGCCPLFNDSSVDAEALYIGADADTLRNTRNWLQQAWLGMPANEWLEGWQQHQANWLPLWTAQKRTWLTNLIDEALQIPAIAEGHRAVQTHSPAVSWAPATQQTTFAMLGENMLHDDHFSLQPTLNEFAVQTGTWTRHADAPVCPTSLLGQLGYRIADMLRLCQPDLAHQGGAHWLASGAARIGQNQGVAWLEMARGLLVHAVQLDCSDLRHARVVNCQLLAPTDWNFHPHGAVAQQLQAYDANNPAIKQQVGLLMAAFDPCVPFSIAPEIHSDSVSSDALEPTRAGHNHA